jgi:hypothetical protein
MVNRTPCLHLIERKNRDFSIEIFANLYRKEERSDNGGHDDDRGGGKVTD